MFRPVRRPEGASVWERRADPRARRRNPERPCPRLRSGGKPHRQGARAVLSRISRRIRAGPNSDPEIYWESIVDACRALWSAGVVRPGTSPASPSRPSAPRWSTSTVRGTPSAPPSSGSISVAPKTCRASRRPLGARSSGRSACPATVALLPGRSRGQLDPAAPARDLGADPQISSSSPAISRTGSPALRRFRRLPGRLSPLRLQGSSRGPARATGSGRPSRSTRACSPNSCRPASPSARSRAEAAAATGLPGRPSGDRRRRGQSLRGARLRLPLAAHRLPELRHDRHHQHDAPAVRRSRYPLFPPYPAAVPGAYSLEIQIFRGYWMVSWFKRASSAIARTAVARERGIEPESLFDELVRQRSARFDGPRPAALLVARRQACPAPKRKAPSSASATSTRARISTAPSSKGSPTRSAREGARAEQRSRRVHHRAARGGRRLAERCRDADHGRRLRAAGRPAPHLRGLGAGRGHRRRRRPRAPPGFRDRRRER